MKKSLFKLIAGLICIAGFGSANAWAVTFSGATYTDSEVEQFRSDYLKNGSDLQISTFGPTLYYPFQMVDNRSAVVFDKEKITQCAEIGIYGKNEKTSFFTATKSVFSLDYGTTENTANGNSTLLMTFEKCSEGSQSADVTLSEEEFKTFFKAAQNAGYTRVRIALKDIYTKTKTGTIASSKTITTDYFLSNASLGYYFDVVVPVKITKDLATDSVFIKYKYISNSTYNGAYKLTSIPEFHGTDDRIYFSIDAKTYAMMQLKSFIRKIAIKKTPGGTGHVVDTTILKIDSFWEMHSTFDLKDSIVKRNYDDFIKYGDSLVVLQYGVVTERSKSLDGQKTYYDTTYSTALTLSPVYRVGCSVSAYNDAASCMINGAVGSIYQHVGMSSTISASTNDDGIEFIEFKSNGADITVLNNLKVESFSDTSIVALFEKAYDFTASPTFSYATSRGKQVVGNAPPVSMNFAYGSDSIAISALLNKPKSKHFIIQYAKLDDGEYHDLYWDYRSVEEFTSKVMYTEALVGIGERFRFVSLSDHGKLIVENASVPLDGMGVKFRIINFDVSGNGIRYEDAMNVANRTNVSVDGNIMILNRICTEKEGIVTLINTNGETILHECKAEKESIFETTLFYDFPTSRTELGESESPDGVLRSYYWCKGDDECIYGQTNYKKYSVSSEKPTVFKLHYVDYYTVYFLDYDGEKLNSQYVLQHTDAVAPANPTRDGYRFIGWDKDFTDVSEPLTITAQYKKVYVATKEISANQCGDLWCGVTQDQKVNTGFSEDGSGLWNTYDDNGSPNNGNSTIKFTIGNDIQENIQKSYSIEAHIDAGDAYYYPFAGVKFNVGENGNDISDWDGICLAYKSTASFSVEVVPLNEESVTLYNNHRASVIKSSDIAFVNIPWSKFKQDNGWGNTVSINNVLSSITEVRFKSTSDNDFKLVTIGRYGTCGGESYVAKKEIEENLCGDLWCGVKQETVANTGFTGENAGTFSDLNDHHDCSGESCGTSEVEFAVGGNFVENIQKAYSVDLSFNNKVGYEFPYSGMSMFVADNGVDITDWEGLCLAYSSDEEVKLSIVADDFGESLGFDNFATNLPARRTVSFKNISWGELKREGWSNKTGDKSEILKSIQFIRISYHGAAGTSSNFKLVTLGRYGTCNGESYVAKKEISAEKCGDLWCGVTNDERVKTGSSNETSGYWYDFDDANYGGAVASSVKLAFGTELHENIWGAYSIDLTFNLGSGSGGVPPMAGIGFNTVDSETGMNISNWEGVCLAYKSSAEGVVIEIQPTDELLAGYDNHRYSLPKAENVTFVNVKWSEFAQGGWGKKVDVANVLSDVSSIKFLYNGAANTSDNFKLVTLGRYGTCDATILEWENASDEIVISDLNVGIGDVKIAEGEQFYANGKIYEGVLTSADLSDLAGATLKPISGVSLESDEDGEVVVATLDVNTPSNKLIIPEDIDVDEVDIGITFVPGKTMTLMLPFDYDVPENLGTISQFTRVEKIDGVWTATGTRVTNNHIKAHTPYLIKVSEESNGNLSSGSVTIKANINVDSDAGEGNWTFKGTYEGKTWVTGDPELGHVYGFAAQQKDGASPGDFVRVGAGAAIPPMRAYLYHSSAAQNTTPSNAPAVKPAPEEPLPKRIVVRIIDAENGDVIEEGEMDESGEIMNLRPVISNVNNVKADRWNDAKGRQLGKKPGAKGVYLKNGKPVFVK